MPISLPLGTCIRRKDDASEGRNSSEEQPGQQAPGRNPGQRIHRKADDQTTDDPTEKAGQSAVAAAVIRIGPLHCRPVALFFALACGFKPRFERVNARILNDGVSSGFLVVHAMLQKEGGKGTHGQVPAEGADPLEGAYKGVNIG